MNDILIGTCLSAAFAIGGFMHELGWRRHLAGSEIVAGKIVGETTGRNGSRSRVSYTYQGSERHFVSTYGGRKVVVGKLVNVAFNPSTGKAEIVNNPNRWVWTIVPGGLAVIVFVGTLVQYS